MTTIKWTCLPFEQLNPAMVYAILRLRSEVFVVEQNCVFQDMDNLDQLALHLCGETNTGLVCYARLLAPGVIFPGASIGRVVTAPASRAAGLGRELMQQALTRCMTKWPDSDITISAQQQLEKFYGSLGFATVSAPYMEDGIPHIKMTRSASHH